MHGCESLTFATILENVDDVVFHDDPELGPDDSNPGDLLRLSLRTVTQFCRNQEIPSQVYTEIRVKVRRSYITRHTRHQESRAFDSQECV